MLASQVAFARPIAGLSAAVMVLGTFLPWGSLSIVILGVRSPGLDFKGTDIGSDIGSVPWGYFMIAAGLAGAVGVARRSRLAVSAGVLGLVFAVLNLLTLNSGTPHATVSIGGETRDLNAALAPHVTPASGSYIVLVASVALLVASLVLRRQTPDH